jgi:hypothetical protein
MRAVSFGSLEDTISRICKPKDFLISSKFLGDNGGLWPKRSGASKVDTSFRVML